MTDLRIPYKSYNSAVSTDLAFQDGANVITTVPGYLERRPGFSAVAVPGQENPIGILEVSVGSHVLYVTIETDVFPGLVPGDTTTLSGVTDSSFDGSYTVLESDRIATSGGHFNYQILCSAPTLADGFSTGGTITGIAPFAGTIRRIFPWHRVNASGTTDYYCMICSADSTQSYVYKFQFGVDSSATLLRTCTTSATPFDFVTSNQTVYFGKDDVADEMWKWDGTNLSKWGIAAPSIAPVIGLSTGIVEPSAVSVALTSGSLTATTGYQYFATYANSTTGDMSDASALSTTTGPFTSQKMQITLVASAEAGVDEIHIYRTTDGGLGTTTLMKEIPGSPFANSNATVDDNAADDALGVLFVIPLATATSGYFYITTYGNSITKHQSTASDLSACSGAFTGKKISVQLTASSDPQVDEIHVYRTTDGGSTNPIQMMELPKSPYPNTTAMITDVTADVDLLESFAPGLRANDPPPPSRGFIVAANRIGSFANNVFYYSGFEEITQGVPEESWPSGLDGNFRPFSSPVYGLAATPTGAAIFTARTIFGVDGDSLDTFRWSTILANRGIKNHENVISIGTSVVWLDTSKQIWLSDIGEMGKDIRTDSKQLVPAQTQLVAHNSGEFNWLLVMDGANQRILPANVDNMHWMVPWPIAGITALASGETADGVVDLLAAIGGVVYKLVPGTYNDGGTPYTAKLKWNLFKIAPDENPEYYGVVDYVALETDAVSPIELKQLNDDDPRQTSVSNTAWKSLMANEQVSTRRSTQGTSVVRKEYMSQPDTTNAQRISIYLEWAAANQNFHLYGVDIKHHRN